MTGSDRSEIGHGIVWRRPPLGGLIAVGGGSVALVSLFLPWYSLRLSATDFASMSIFVQIHVHGRESLTAGALVAGIWDWRTLIAVGAAAIVLYVVIRAQAAPTPRQWPDWQVLVALGGGTTAVTVLAAVVSPVGVLDAASPLRVSSSLTYGGAVGLAGALAALVGGLVVWQSERGESEGAHLSLPVPQA